MSNDQPMPGEPIRADPLLRRFKSIEDRIDRVEERLEEGDKTMSTLTDKIDVNTTITMNLKKDVDAVAVDVKEIVEVFRTVKAAGKLGYWIGTAMKWTAAVVVAGALLWYWFRTGTPTLPK